jgi:hypothetical protein
MTDFDELLARIEAGIATAEDLRRLREEIISQPSQSTQLGKYNINIGTGQNVQIGDRTYVEINEEAVQAIVSAIQKKIDATPQKGSIQSSVPFPRLRLPENFVERPDALNAVKQKLLAEGDKTLVVSAISGLGGLGKSVLAAAVFGWHFVGDARSETRFADHAGELDSGTGQIAGRL